MPQVNANFPTSLAQQIERKVYAKKYPQYPFDTLIPIDRSMPAHVQSIGTIVMDSVGEARFTSGGLNPTFPTADINARLVNLDVYYGEMGITISESDAQAAALGMGDPVAMKYSAAFMAVRRLMNDLAMNGRPEIGVKGLLNHDGIESSPAAKALSAMTGQEAFQAIIDLLSMVSNQTLGRYTADTLILPLAEFNILKTKRFDLTPGLTVMSALRQSEGEIEGQEAPGLRVGYSNDLTNKAIAYPRTDEVLRMFIPQGYKLKPRQPLGNGWAVPGSFKISPLQIKDLSAFAELEWV